MKYDKGFVNHEAKIKLAFDYFRKNEFVSSGCFNAPKPASDDVLVALAADTEARLSIFYADFVYDHNKSPVIESPPLVEPEMLQRASQQLETATRGPPFSLRYYNFRI